MIVDGDGRRFTPGALLVDNGRVLAAGAPEHIGSCADVCNRNYEKFVLIPALVNAHAHLDLTHIGLQPRDGGFLAWVNMILAGRATTDDAIRDSVLRGAELAIAGGTAFIGDIAGIGSTVAVEALRESDLHGVGYVEVFGIGKRQQRASELIMQVAANTATYADGVRLGVQPHAPYSCGLDVYRAAAKTGLPLSTHLAELIEEIEYSTTGSGTMLEFSQRLGVWDESASVSGKHPIDALAEILHETPCVAAHLNYVNDAHIKMLANWPISVAYCPRASAYFGHDGHRYRDMLAAGVNVCLGTDSIVCLDTPNRITVLDEMRFLNQRDAVDSVLLLRMATVNGAKALGVDPALVTFAEGETAGILAIEIDENSAIDPLQQALTSNAAPIWATQ